MVNVEKDLLRISLIKISNSNGKYRENSIKNITPK